MSNSLLLEYRDINQVYPYTRNGRRNEETVDQVAVSIQSYGFQQPIVVDKNGVIVVGHTRYAAAKKLKLTEVPVIVFGGDDQLAKEYRLADNRIQENSDWDKDVLLNELLDLKDTPLPTGFTDSELDKLLDSGDNSPRGLHSGGGGVLNGMGLPSQQNYQSSSSSSDSSSGSVVGVLGFLSRITITASANKM